MPGRSVAMIGALGLLLLGGCDTASRDAAVGVPGQCAGTWTVGAPIELWRGQLCEFSAEVQTSRDEVAVVWNAAYCHDTTSAVHAARVSLTEPPVVLATAEAATLPRNAWLVPVGEDYLVPLEGASSVLRLDADLRPVETIDLPLPVLGFSGFDPDILILARYGLPAGIEYQAWSLSRRAFVGETLTTVADLRLDLVPGRGWLGTIGDGGNRIVRQRVGEPVEEVANPLVFSAYRAFADRPRSQLVVVGGWMEWSALYLLRFDAEPLALETLGPLPGGLGAQAGWGLATGEAVAIQRAGETRIVTTALDGSGTRSIPLVVEGRLDWARFVVRPDTTIGAVVYSDMISDPGVFVLRAVALVCPR